MPDLISNLIANLLNSEWFYIFVGIWILISIANRRERSLLTDRLIDLTSKPVIFDEDQSPGSVPFYPRKTFERVARGVASALVRIPKDINAQLIKAIKAQLNFIISQEKPWKVLGYILFLIFIFFFVWADAIAIVNSLDAYGLIRSVWEPFTFYELAVAFGSFFAIIVGALVTREMQSKSDFSDWDQQEGAWKKVARIIAVVLIISGLFVVFALGLGRALKLNYIAEDWVGMVTNIVNFTFIILVPINTVLATLLIHHEAIKGLLLALVFVQGIFLLFVYIWQYIAEILGAMGPFTVDIIYRFMLAIMFMLVFILFTPLDLLTSLIPTRKN